MKLSSIIKILEEYAPPALQESYDNSGLLIGSPESDINAALITLDVTEEVVNEAVAQNINLIIAHHPLIFKAVKSLTGKTEVEKCIIKCIKQDIAVYVAHTNADSTQEGVSAKMAEKLNLKNLRVLSPAQDLLHKIVVFVPSDYAQKVREAMFNAGAGHIGDYDQCSYNLSGQGTFRAGEESNPFTGEKGEIHFEPEERIETIVPYFKTPAVIQSILNAHPYEEVAYDIYPLKNTHPRYGLGISGEFAKPLIEKEFLKLVKETFNAGGIRHSPFTGKEIKKIALCGGSGSFLIKNALSAYADAFITADVKYHDFFELQKKMLLVDIGHYESEQYTMDIFYALLTKKIPNFAVHLSKINTNPINYY